MDEIDSEIHQWDTKMYKDSHSCYTRIYEELKAIPIKCNIINYPVGFSVTLKIWPVL